MCDPVGASFDPVVVDFSVVDAELDCIAVATSAFQQVEYIVMNPDGATTSRRCLDIHQGKVIVHISVVYLAIGQVDFPEFKSDVCRGTIVPFTDGIDGNSAIMNFQSCDSIATRSQRFYPITRILINVQPRNIH